MFAALTLTLGVLAAPPVSPQVQRQRQEAKFKHDKAVAEMKRKSDQLWQQSQADQARFRQKILQDIEKQDAARHPSRKLPPFDAAAAPQPVDCLKSFIATAKSATSMEQLLPYLPADEAASLKEFQKTYDPKQAAASREWHRKQNPKSTEESLTYITNPPYVNALNRHKEIANKILDVLNVTVNGSEALIEVSTLSTAVVNGTKYPFGTAKIEMHGEGNYWKLGAYNDSNVNYRELPHGR